MVHQTAVAFTNRSGRQLFGILEQPIDSPPARLGVILLSPGVKMRVGPGRLYRRLANVFVGLGLPVLRFDFWGLGDSEGELTETFLKDVYNHIEVGRFVDDTLDAVDWMQRHGGVDRVVVSGLCGGAITGLLAGSKDPRIAGLLALGMTPVLASKAADPLTYMTRGQLRGLRRGYLKKLTAPTSWLRMMTLRSDFRLMWRSLTEPLRRNQAGRQESAQSESNDNASPLFPQAFFAMASSHRPILLIFGGTDRLRWEFDEKFVSRHRERLASLKSIYDVHVIDRANHVLSFREWQLEMLEVSVQWLVKHFPQNVRDSAATAVRQ